MRIKKGLKLRSRVVSIAWKEFFHIIHDPRTLAIIFLMPVIQLVMFGYALNLEIQNVEIAIADYSHSTQSRALIERFKGSKFFKPFYFEGNLSQVDELFKSRKARAVMIIPQDFEKQLQKNAHVQIQFLIDASDANAATYIRQYCYRVITDFNATQNKNLPLPFDIRDTILFNPDMKSTYFFVPGLMALLLVMISALLTSITITREKETGTLEQILVSPIQPYEIIIGKVLPYILLAFISASLILIVAVFLFQVPFRGSLLLLVLLTTLYIITGLSLGLMISTISQTQQVAMMIALTATLLPTLLLSGFIFPIPSMPKILQYISYIIPASFYLLIVRGIILKASSFMDLLIPTSILVIMSTILLNVSARKFSITLEK